MRQNKLIKKILISTAVTAGVGAITVALAAAPGGIMALKSLADWYQRATRQERYRIRKTFIKLRRERLIDMIPTPDGKMRIVLTDSGKNKILEYRIEDIKIQPQKKWDKKWRVVMFDIPETYKKGRDALRRKLAELKFFQLQKSVWLYPFECRNEIDFIAEFFKVSPYVRVGEILRFDGESEIKEKFGIK